MFALIGSVIFTGISSLIYFVSGKPLFALKKKKEDKDAELLGINEKNEALEYKRKLINHINSLNYSSVQMDKYLAELTQLKVEMKRLNPIEADLLRRYRSKKAEEERKAAAAAAALAASRSRSSGSGRGGYSGGGGGFSGGGSSGRF